MYIYICSGERVTYKYVVVKGLIALKHLVHLPKGHMKMKKTLRILKSIALYSSSREISMSDRLKFHTGSVVTHVLLVYLFQAENTAYQGINTWLPHMSHGTGIGTISSMSWLLGALIWVY